MIRLFYTYLVMLPFMVVASCTAVDSPDKTPIARVGDRVLMLREVQNAIPDGIAREDSFLLADDFIHRWIKTELLIRKAQENLTYAQKDMARELEEYKNSLLIYRYQKELMDEKMDTLVTTEEVADFYDKNPDDFILVTDLVKGTYLQVPIASPKWREAKSICNRTTDRDYQELQSFCEKYAGSSNLYIDNWIELPNLIRHVPYLTTEKAGLTRNRSRWESRDRENYYLLYIFDFRGKGSVAPMEYVAENIKKIIINNRKAQFIKQVENNIYTEGVRNNKFKIYAYEKN